MMELPLNLSLVDDLLTIPPWAVGMYFRRSVIKEGLMQNHWLLDAIQDLESFAEDNNLPGFIEGLGKVLEVYAAEAMEYPEEKASIMTLLRK